MGIALQTMTNELTHVFLLSVGAFLLAMFLTPIYTFFAYRYRFWKRQRSESTDGKKLKILPNSKRQNCGETFRRWLE